MLIVSGGFFCKSWKLYQLQIKDIKLYNSLEDISKEDGFFVFSYSLSTESIGVKVKSSNLPKVIFVKIGDIKELRLTYKPVSLEILKFSLDKKAYIQRVKEIKKRIEEGIIYQLNLSTKIDFFLKGQPLDLFLKFFQTQRTPYAFFLDLGDFFIISGSMELFLQKKNNTIISKPIKGTAKSGKKLKESLKDKAENLMILDMMRNDLSKIAKVGSVKVEELFKIERYSTLFQMHSTVSAKTDAEFEDILLNTFPPASVTGAPKKKAVEIIDLLEPHSRDYYCGCAGFRWGKDFTLSVLIRTAFGTKDKLSYFAGSGIVYDSQEEKEWKETLSKVQAFYSFSSF